MDFEMHLTQNYASSAAMDANATLISVENLHTFFYTRRGTVKAVDGIDLCIRRQETLGLVGESGCGKSVTALSLLQLVSPPGRIVRGRIILEGEDILSFSEEEMRSIRGRKISMIFQEPMTSLDPVFTVGSELTETLRLHHKVSRQQARLSAIQMLEKVGIPEPERRLREYPHELSGGTQQRVMIAIALICNPLLLIADEPTTALDVTIQAQILHLITELQQDLGTSVLLITHDLGVVAETCDNVAVMYAGNIIEYAPVKELFASPLHPYTVRLQASIPRIDVPVSRLATIPGSVPDLGRPPSGCKFHPRCSKALPICRRTTPQLQRIRENHLVRCWLYQKEKPLP